MLWKGRSIDSEKCLHCGKQFKLSRCGKSIVLCGCKSASPSSVDLARFQSAFLSERAHHEYTEYLRNKTRKWKPQNPDTGSLAVCVKRFGEQQGLEKYKERCKRKATTSIAHFLRVVDGNAAEAQKLQNKRQSVGAVEQFIDRYGVEDGVARWAARNKKWAQTMHTKKMRENTCAIPVELLAERDRKLQFEYCCGILTNLAVRLFGEQIPSSEASIDGIRHLDHQYSKAAAIINRSNVKVVSSPHNLKWLSKAENLAKKSICAISYEALESVYAEWKKQDGKLFDDICEALLRHWRNEGMQV